jgi:glutamate racemase
LNAAIGILDSGVGGMTVAREVMRQLPRERIIYFGDNARCPYGSRDLAEVQGFTEQIIDYLMGQEEIKLIVVACNTATAAGLEQIKRRVPVPVIDVISSGARAAIKATRLSRIGVIGTEGTIRSGAYQNALLGIKPGLYVASLACPDFVPLVESDQYQKADALEVVRSRLQPMQAIDIDCLILGCTHYPILAPLIQEVMGPDVTLISSDDETAREASTILSHQGLLVNEGPLPQHLFITTGDMALFQRIGTDWLTPKVDANSVNWKRENPF